MNDGGPAFPSLDSKGMFTAPSGMSLLDFFAAAALQGMLAYPGDAQGGSAHNNATPEDCAYKAYAFATAMLAERSRDA